jgi:tetratricopeptide (TPR) repeat protein
MAGLDPAIHVFGETRQDVDARHRAGHDEGIGPGSNAIVPAGFDGRQSGKNLLGCLHPDQRSGGTMPGLRNPVIYSTFVAGAFAFFEPALAQSARDLCAKETGDKAIAACDKAIADNPKDADSYSNRGFSWSVKGDQDRAIADFNEALKLNPKHVRALSNRGIAWNRKGDPDRAIADATEALKVNKRHAKAYNNRAVALIRKREFDKAIADLNESIKLNPKDASAYFNRGNALEMKGSLSDALADFKKYVALSPNDPDGTRAVSRIEDRLKAR